MLLSIRLFALSFRIQACLWKSKPEHGLLCNIDMLQKGVAEERAKGNIEGEFTYLFRICEICETVTSENPILARTIRSDAVSRKHLQLVNKKSLESLEECQNRLAELYKSKEISMVRNGQEDGIYGQVPDKEKRKECVRSSNYVISPVDLVKFVDDGRELKSALIVDFREVKTEFIKYAKESQISVVGIPRSCLENSCIFQVLQKSVQLNSRVLLNRLADFDLVVLMDSGDELDPLEANGKIIKNSCAGVLYAALYDYNNNCRPKAAPVYLKGGFQKWRTMYPAYVVSSDGCPRRASLLGDGDIDIVNAIAKLRTTRQPTPTYDLLKPISRPSSRGPSPVPNVPGEAQSFHRPSLPPSTSLYSLPCERGAFTVPDKIPFIENGMPRIKPEDSTRFTISAKSGPPPRPIPPSTRTSSLGRQKPDLPARFPPNADRKGKPNVGANGFSRGDQTGKPKDVRTLGGARPDTMSLQASVSSLMPSVSRSVPSLQSTRSYVERTSKEPVEKKLAEFQRNVMSVYSACVENLKKKSRRGQVQAGYTGLINIVNTCFMNASLQALANTPQLREIFCKKNFARVINRDSKMGSQGVISAAFTALLDTMWSGDFAAIQPEAFRAVFAEYVNEFLANGQQHDAAEFENILIDALHEDTNIVSCPKPVVMPDFTGNNIHIDAREYEAISRKFADSPINHIFNLQTVSPKRCTSCKKQTVNFEGMLFVALDLKTDRSETTLEECLDRYFSSEDVEVECTNCKKRQRMTRYTKMWRLPKVLVIQLKRFGESGIESHYVKTDVNVRFSKQLNVKPFLHEKADDLKCFYSLYSVTNHVGSLNSGHYYAYVKNPKTRQWLEINDDIVRPLSPDTSLQSKDAFVLYYTNE
ncbi:hypothetical protein L596_010985 [Steinernema carpocapsae]|uniref:ubiquitinyl hydrolase 1 n=2 Tax=Steinernema carpocapsae TaxID=34508 RepID=A0A4U5NSW9_STECR|nr:hypothetical protein L596_010985 [Steinernema carpocapsae]